MSWGSWWNEDVRFMTPKASRKPYKAAAVTQLAVGLPLAIGAGLVASRILHTRTAGYLIRSLVRGFIYREVFRGLIWKR